MTAGSPVPVAANPIPAGGAGGALAEAFGALDRAGVAWARLRDGGPGDGDRDPGDPSEVDLLVDPAHAGGGGVALAAAGFVALPRRGLGTHRFFLTLTAGGWLKLDVVTDLAFGRRRTLVAAGAGEALARRVATPAGWTLAPADAFWALALHALLDRATVEPRHLARLAALASHASAHDPLARALGPALARRLLGAATNGDATAFAACAGPARLALVRAQPRAAAAGLARDRLRAAAATLTVPARPGLLVALLGPDGSGKSTLADGLRSSLPVRSRLVYGGLYGQAAGHDTRGRVAHLARFAAAARYEARRGAVVVADRHPLESAPTGRGLRARLRRLALAAAPAPDLALVLDCDGPTMFARKGEHDPAALEARRRRLAALAATLPRAEVLDAGRPADDVRAAATAAVWQALRARLAPEGRP